jgi:hypothetical protein
MDLLDESSVDSSVECAGEFLRWLTGASSGAGSDDGGVNGEKLGLRV